jgi:hypothetical protein
LALNRDLIMKPRTDAAREITRRGIKRGEIASTVHSSTIVDLLVGALSTHWEMTPESGRPRLQQTFPAFAESLVGIILAGVAATSRSDAAITKLA